MKLTSGPPHAVRLFTKALVRGVAVEDQARGLCLHVLAKSGEDFTSHPRRFHAHGALHKLTVDQFVPDPVGQLQQLLGRDDLKLGESTDIGLSFPPA